IHLAARAGMSSSSPGLPVFLGCFGACSGVEKCPKLVKSRFEQLPALLNGRTACATGARPAQRVNAPLHAHRPERNTPLYSEKVNGAAPRNTVDSKSRPDSMLST